MKINGVQRAWQSEWLLSFRPNDRLRQYREIKWLRHWFCRFYGVGDSPATAPIDALPAIRLASHHSGTNVNVAHNDFSSYFRWFFSPLSNVSPFILFLNLNNSIVNRVPFTVLGVGQCTAATVACSAHTTANVPTIVYDVCHRLLLSHPTLDPLTDSKPDNVFSIEKKPLSAFKYDMYAPTGYLFQTT